MNEDQARTILEKVGKVWNIPLESLSSAPLLILWDNLQTAPVEGVEIRTLLEAIHRRRIDPRWVE